MNKLTKAQTELWEMDELAKGTSPIHGLHPLAKLAVTVLYIFTVVSFPKYDFSALAVMVLYPVLLFQAAGIFIIKLFSALCKKWRSQYCSLCTKFLQKGHCCGILSRAQHILRAGCYEQWFSNYCPRILPTIMKSICSYM